ncbi:MAG: hypothetical protein QOD32_2342 [Pyrinomonadaceae bacterium]|jgi:hypothetical protein|nr:hypothetical protein [Pyrinomonadaceae bacterium]
MRRTYTILATLALITLFAGCTGERVTSPANGNNANSAGAAASNSNGAGTRDGIGPRDTGIGGTSEGNANSAVKGNSNVEPTGVNKNAGRDTPANANKP